MGFASTGRTRYYEELPTLETLLQQRKSRSPTLVNNKTLPIPAVQVVGTAQRDVSKKKKTKFLSAALQYPNVWNRLNKTSLLCTIKVHERLTPTDLI